MIQERGRVSDARPWPGLQGKGGLGWGEIVSFNDGGLGRMEREGQIGRERTSNRSRGKNGKIQEWLKQKGKMKFEVTGAV